MFRIAPPAVAAPLATLALVFTAALATPVAARERLTVYTYDSFAADWGPGPVIEEAFEAICDCDLVFVGAGDGAALLSRVTLEGARSEASVVLGLDSNLMVRALDTGLFAPHGTEITADLLPIDWTDDTFVPFDWGYFAFVHRTGLDVPGSFDELADSSLDIVVQDPRSSTPGLGLTLWIDTVFAGEAADIWAGLADNIVTVTPGWSEAYGLFLDGEADMVLSYTTSPAYHLIAEADPGFAAAIFEEGHYLQVEVAAALAAAPAPDLARDFLAFIGSDAFQSVIPATNWMYPVTMPGGGLPEGFPAPLPADRALFLAPPDAASRRDAAIDAWRTGLAR